MKVKDFKYILTNVGGGWGTIHQFYGVTPDGYVYSTKKFDYRNLSPDNDIDCKLLGHLDKIELGLKEESALHYAVMDASDLTVYEVGETLKILHYAPEISANNPKIYNDIQRIVLAYNDKEAQAVINNGNFKVGEVKTAEEFRKVIHLLNSGHPICTTHHAKLDSNVVDKIKELIEVE